MDKRFMSGAMSGKSMHVLLEFVFWRVIFNSHLDEFHIDRTEEDLLARVNSGTVTRASSFINLDDDHDVLDMLLEEIQKKADKIQRFLEFREGYKTLQWVTRIPEGYGAILVNDKGEVYHPENMVVVIRKDKYNTIEMIDAYPVLL